MSDMLPLATYSLNVEPYSPTPALNFKIPVTIRITMAAIDPEPFDDDKKPSTLRIIKGILNSLAVSTTTKITMTASKRMKVKVNKKQMYQKGVSNQKR